MKCFISLALERRFLQADGPKTLSFDVLCFTASVDRAPTGVGSLLAFAARALAEFGSVLDPPGDFFVCLGNSISPLRQVMALGHLDLVHLCCKDTEHVRQSHAGAPQFVAVWLTTAASIPPERTRLLYNHGLMFSSLHGKCGQDTSCMRHHVVTIWLGPSWPIQPAHQSHAAISQDRLSCGSTLLLTVLGYARQRQFCTVYHGLAMKRGERFQTSSRARNKCVFPHHPQFCLPNGLATAQKSGARDWS